MLKNYYGIVASFVFSVPYCILGVYAGVLSGKVNRSVLLGLSCFLWSSTTLAAGYLTPFVGFVIMRFLLGAFESACNPASYSLIADYFPPAYRSTANAIETSGSYVGGGLGAVCILLIKMYGWRAMYKTIGIAGMIMGLLTMLLIKEPPRGRYDLQESFKKGGNQGS